MKKLENTMNVVVLITVSSTMVLIFTGVFISLFSIKDYTIIAGLIGFVGAIIGGSITLIGVRMTIKEARRKDELEKIEEKVFAGEYLIDELSKLATLVESYCISLKNTYSELEEPDAFNYNRSIISKCNKFYDETDDFNERIIPSPVTRKLGYSLYKETKELLELVNNTGLEIEEEGFHSVYYGDDFLEDIQSHLIQIKKLILNYEKIHSVNLRRYRELNEQ
ncbi:hypothetical protein [Lysinibacillus fusiformis]|uniref:hypothetical protein n=1 Tax=Lysinibacillus fusiformis TaxID=28031 RepID=UPI003AAAA03A